MSHRQQAVRALRVVDVPNRGLVLVVCPPRERPMALLNAPLLRLRRTDGP